MKPFLLLCLGIFFFNESKSQTPSILYEITGPDLKSPSYIFGTIHLIPQEDYQMSKTLKNIIKSCEQIIIEADIKPSLKEQIDLVPLLMLPDGKTLLDYCTAQQYQQIEHYFLDSLNISEKKWNQYQKLKPIFTSMAVLKSQLGKTKSYETEILKLASKKPKIYLETLKQQMAFLDQMSIEEQIKGLETDFIKEYHQLVNVYKTGNLDSVHQFISQSKDYHQMDSMMISNRNQNWIEPLMSNFKSNSTFVAVGAGHLGGDLGILNLLRKKGYTVKAITL